MQYAIFDTGPGFLQWMGEAANVQTAIKELREDSDEIDHSAQNPSEPFIVVYQLTDQELAHLDQLLSKGAHIAQNFKDAGQVFSLAQVRSIVGS